MSIAALSEALESLGKPSDEHIVATHDIAREANESWLRLQSIRLDLAERIADAAAFHGEVDAADLEAYRAIHGQQVAARARRTVAADELDRVIKAVSP